MMPHSVCCHLPKQNETDLDCKITLKQKHMPELYRYLAKRELLHGVLLQPVHTGSSENYFVTKKNMSQ
jgi:hypothetical protein